MLIVQMLIKKDIFKSRAWGFYECLVFRENDSKLMYEFESFIYLYKYTYIFVYIYI